MTTVRAILGLVVVVIAAAFATLLAWPPVAQVTAGHSAEYPALTPHAYRVSSARALAAVSEALDALPRATDVELGEVEASARVESVGGIFSDRVRVWVEANGEGGSVIFVEATSEQGRFNFGQAARTVERVYEAIDSELAGTRWTPASGEENG